MPWDSSGGGKCKCSDSANHSKGAWLGYFVLHMCATICWQYTDLNKAKSSQQLTQRRRKTIKSVSPIAFDYDQGPAAEMSRDNFVDIIGVVPPFPGDLCKLHIYRRLLLATCNIQADGQFVGRTEAMSMKYATCDPTSVHIKNTGLHFLCSGLTSWSWAYFVPADTLAGLLSP